MLRHIIHLNRVTVRVEGVERDLLLERTLVWNENFFHFAFRLASNERERVGLVVTTRPRRHPLPRCAFKGDRLRAPFASEI